MYMGGAQSGRTFSETLRYAFRERQVYVRSEGALRYIVIRPWHLLGVAGLCVAGLAWLSVTSFSFLYKAYEVSDARDRAQKVQFLYDGRIADMQTAVERLNEKLMLDQGAYVGKVDHLRDDFDNLLDRQKRLEVFFKQGWLPVQEVTEQAETQAAPESQPKAKPGPDKAGQSPGNRHSQNVATFTTPREAEQPLNMVRILFTEFKKRQLELLDRVIAMGERKAASLRKVHEKLGLDPETVVANTKLSNDAMGGPLLPVQKGMQPQDALDQRLLLAHEKFVEAEKLLHAISRMPILMPLDKGYRLTSGFGFRRDPFKDILAMHAGVDLMSAYGSAIKATAPGVVIRAELSDAYGRVVDIQHDNGITTRYAHMSTMEVEAGDQIAAGQLVGRVGTSGRSTGPHLHYETRVHGKPIDPYEFIRVTRDVVQKETK